MSLLNKVSLIISIVSLSLLLAGEVWGEGEFLSSLERDVTGLVATVKPSLVTINTIQTVKAQNIPPAWKKTYKAKSLPSATILRVGSGVVFDQKGHVITSASVVSGGDEFEVLLTDGKKYKGKLVGTNPGLNLAVLKVEAENLTPASLGNSDQLRVGSWIIVLGNAYGLPTAVAVGLYNGTRPDGFIQMSASVAPGNSGGPVLNSRGEVIGLVSAKVSEASSFSIITEEDGSQVRITGSQGLIDLPSASISLAIPMNQIKTSAQKIIRYGTAEKGFLGVYLEDLPGQEGVFISEVVRNSPAEKAGIRADDIITFFNGKKVVGSEHFRHLIEETPPRTPVDFKVLRGENSLDLRAELGKTPADLNAPLPPAYDFSAFSNLARLKDWEAGIQEQISQEVMEKTTRQYMNQIKNQYKEIFETQKQASAYNQGKMEQRISDLERQLELYRRVLDSLRIQLQEVKASQAP